MFERRFYPFLPILLWVMLLLQPLLASPPSGEVEVFRPKIMDPIPLDPILDFVEAGRPVSAQKFIQLFGEKIFVDERLNQLASFLAAHPQASWVDALHIFAQGDPRVSAVAQAVQAEKQEQQEHLQRALQSFGERDFKLLSILQVLAGGGALNVDQTLQLLSHSIHPKVAALISFISAGHGQQQGGQQVSFTLGDLTQDEGALSKLLSEQGRSDILSVVNSSERVRELYHRYGRFPISALVANSQFLDIVNLLDQRGQGQLRGLMRHSRALRELFINRGRFSLEDILADNIAQLVGDGSLPVTIRSVGSGEGGASLALVGSFRGRFGQVPQGESALEVLRVANLGGAPALDLALGHLPESFSVQHSSCGEQLGPGESCELLLRAEGGQGRVVEQFLIYFSHSQGEGELRVPLDVLFSHHQ